MIFLTKLSASHCVASAGCARVKKMKHVAFWIGLALGGAWADAAAQQKNPCEDSLYLRLKEAPAVTLTDSERRYVDQKRKDCAAYKAGVYKPSEPQPVPPAPEPKTVETPPLQPNTSPPSAPKDSSMAMTPKVQPAPAVKPEPKTDVKPEPAPDAPKPEQASQEPKGEAFLTPRTVGIMGAIAAAIVGLAIALGGAPKSPF